MIRTTRSNRGLIPASPRGFTLVELLVVLLIILLVSAAALPTIISGLRQRQVSEAGRIFQAALAGARDAAIGSNAPRGIRLLPDPILTVPAIGQLNAGATTWACNRFIPIETGPDYREGRITFYQGWVQDTQYQNYWDINITNATLPVYGPNVLFAMQSFYDVGGFSTELTSWAWNLRVGDKIQFEPEGSANKSVGAGHVYTVVGPVVTPNPENFINYGDSGPPTPTGYGGPAAPEFLLLVNGIDDDKDGFVDYGFDGIDNDNDGVIDVYDRSEVTVEVEKWLGAQYTDASQPSPPIRRYTAKRRPVPAKGARETLLPSNVVIDLTSWNRRDGANPERSRLPTDSTARYVDILMDPSGQIIQSTAYSSPSAFISPFLHFWLTDREGVLEPLWGMNTSVTPPVPNPNPQATAMPITNRRFNMLPMPVGTPGYSPSGNQYLQGERMLITLFARTGNMAINSLQEFDATDINIPFYAAQRGVREAP